MVDNEKLTNVNHLNIYSVPSSSLITDNKKRLKTIFYLSSLSNDTLSSINKSYNLPEDLNKLSLVKLSGFKLDFKSEDDIKFYLSKINILGEKSANLILKNFP